MASVGSNAWLRSRPVWAGACEDVRVHVGHDPALVVLTDTDADGHTVDMSINATGPTSMEELIAWLRDIALALETGARLDD